MVVAKFTSCFCGLINPAAVVFHCVNLHLEGSVSSSPERVSKVSGTIRGSDGGGGWRRNLLCGDSVFHSRGVGTEGPSEGCGRRKKPRPEGELLNP